MQFAQDAVRGQLPEERVVVSQTLQHALGLGVTERHQPLRLPRLFGKQSVNTYLRTRNVLRCPARANVCVLIE